MVGFAFFQGSMSIFYVPTKVILYVRSSFSALNFVLFPLVIRQCKGDFVVARGGRVYPFFCGEAYL